MRACSGVTTSMITPPLSIWARPDLTLNEPFTPLLPLREPLRSATIEILRRGCLCSPPRRAGRSGAYLPTRWGGELSLEPLQDQRAFRGVFVIGQQPVPMQAGQHVHLLEHIEQRRHCAAGQVGIRGGAGFLATRVELADEEQRLHCREGDPELADRAVALLCVSAQG